MRFILSVLILLSLRSAGASNLGLSLDWADFRGDSIGMSWLEVYSSLNRENFSYKLNESAKEFIGVLHFSIEIENENGAIVDSLAYSSPIRIPADEPTTKQFRILNVHPFHLPCGNYDITVFACDSAKNVCDTASLKISLVDYAAGNYGSSGIMLAYSATPSNEQSALVRLNTKMFPNPSAIFNLNSIVAYHYVEFYLPDTGSHAVGIRTKIISADTVFREFDTDWRTFSGGGGGNISGFSIAGFPDGYYSLIVELLDTNNRVLTFSQKDFAVAKLPRSIDAVITAEMTQKLRDILFYVLKPDELKLFDEMTPSNKAMFWKKFWSGKDTNTETPENEFMEQYIARWEYANKTFARHNEQGWRTDQGRVYILYGAPSTIERHNVELSNNTWEVWNYFDKNYFFIFSDALGLGGLKLVHSNVDGEIQNEYWQNELFNGPTRFYKEPYIRD